jgi:hypothetical protein
MALKLQSVTRFDSLSLQSAPKFYMAQNWPQKFLRRGECTSNPSRDVVIGERSTKKTKWREPLVEAVGWSQLFDAEFSRCKLNELGRKVGRFRLTGNNSKARAPGASG